MLLNQPFVEAMLFESPVVVSVGVPVKDTTAESLDGKLLIKVHVPAGSVLTFCDPVAPETLQEELPQ